ncbi:MAG: DUF4115 domain-containing protein [Deltaproteobacteria bacterium]|nr:DUF4115 domain-containing protein [Deltaproteobacteria bacterium]
MSGALPGFEELRPRREALGLSLDEVALVTRLSVEWLVALEDGRVADLPQEPYRSAYLRTYREVLELGPVEVEAQLVEDQAPPPSEPPRRTPRQVIALLGVAGLVLVVGIWLAVATGGRGHRSGEELSDSFQTVRLAAQGAGVRVKVHADGELVFDGVLSPSEPQEFSGRERVELDLPSLEAVKIRHNGSAVTPQGVQDAPRKLVFIDDSRGVRP